MKIILKFITLITFLSVSGCLFELSDLEIKSLNSRSYSSTDQNSSDSSVSSIPDLVSDLIAYYSFNGTLSNHASLLHNGSSTNEIYINDRNGVAGSAYYCDGLGNYITIANHPDLLITPSKTIAIWIKATNANGKTSGIIAKGDGNLYRDYGIWQLNGDQYLMSQSYTSNGDLGHLWVNTNNYQNNWHHIAWTKTGRDMKFYYDGKLTMSYSIPFGDSFSYTTNDLFIGYGHIHSFYTGSVDECRIYNRELSASEITELYQLSY